MLALSYIVREGTTPAESLARIYGRRLRHTVQRLDRHRRPVRLRRIRVTDASWAFMLFLDEQGSALVARTGVRQMP
ncbi:hypothetical protein [Streptomyces sp. NPDC055794]